MTNTTAKKHRIDWDTVIAENAQITVAAYHDGTRARAMLSVCRGLNFDQFEQTLLQIVQQCMWEAEVNGIALDLSKLRQLTGGKS